MELKKLLGIRPKGTDAAAIRAAITGAEEAKAAAQTRVTALEAGRSAMLLDGTPADVEKAERDLAAARADMDRAAAMLDGLRPRMASAEAGEKLAQAKAAIAEAEAVRGRFLSFLLETYPLLAEKIAAGLAIEEQAGAAISRAHALAGALPVEQQEGLKLPDMPAASLSGGYAVGGFGGAVQLPSVAGPAGWSGAPQHWPR